MREFKILTDTCSNLSAELRQKYGIDHVPMNFVFDGEEHVASLDWDEYTPKAYYDLMRNGKIIKTTQVPGERYIEVFNKYVEEGKDVLYVACSSALSGSVNTATVIAKEIMEQHPEAKIVCVDALISGMGEGALAVKAAEMKNEGKTIEETAEWLEKNKLCYNQTATVENLNYLRRAGRIKAAAAFFGNIFGVKPIIISDIKGDNVAVKKVKGRKASFAEIVAQIKENVVNPEEQTLYIDHADSEEDAIVLKEMIEKEVAFKNISIGYIAPIMGASVGPGTVAAYYYGKEVTYCGE